MLSVDISLTSSGVGAWEQVVALTYAALDLIARQGVTQELSARFEAEGALAFKFMEKEADPSDYASDLAGRLHVYPPEQVLSGPILRQGFDAASVRAVLEALTPEKMVVTLTSSSSARALNQSANHLTEPVYGTVYAPIELSSALLAACSSPVAVPSLRLPDASNPFLATEFTMLPPSPPPPEAAAPSVVRSDASATLWHRVDTSFGSPHASVSLLLKAPLVAQSSTGSALAQLYSSLLAEGLKPVLNDASNAQLSVSVAAGSTGFELVAYGLSQKLPALVRAAAAQFVSVPLERYAAHKQLLVRALTNEAATPTPTTFAKTVFSQLLSKIYYTPDEELAALQASSVSDLAAFRQALVNASYALGLAMGNIAAEDAASLVGDVTQLVGRQPLPEWQRPTQAVANLQGQSYLMALDHPNPKETNGAVRLMLQLGQLDAHQAAAAELLGDMLEHAFFYELRTVQQLGYIVQCGARAATRRESLGSRQ